MGDTIHKTNHNKHHIETLLISNPMPQQWKPEPLSPNRCPCRLHAVRTATAPDADSGAEWGCHPKTRGTNSASRALSSEYVHTFPHLTSSLQKNFFFALDRIYSPVTFDIV